MCVTSVRSGVVISVFVLLNLLDLKLDVCGRMKISGIPNNGPYIHVVTFAIKIMIHIHVHGHLYRTYKELDRPNSKCEAFING